MRQTNRWHQFISLKEFWTAHTHKRLSLCLANSLLLLDMFVQSLKERIKLIIWNLSIYLHLNRFNQFTELLLFFNTASA